MTDTDSSSVTSSAAAERLAERYGGGDRHPYRRRVAVGALAVVLGSLLAWWIWVSLGHANPEVRWQLDGYQALSDTSVDIRWTIDREPGLAVECVVRARNGFGEEVGRARVPVPSSPDPTVEMQHLLTTSDLAIIAEVLTCVDVAG